MRFSFGHCCSQSVELAASHGVMPATRDERQQSMRLLLQHGSQAQTTQHSTGRRTQCSAIAIFNTRAQQSTAQHFAMRFLFGHCCSQSVELAVLQQPATCSLAARRQSLAVRSASSDQFVILKHTRAHRLFIGEYFHPLFIAAYSTGKGFSSENQYW